MKLVAERTVVHGHHVLLEHRVHVELDLGDIDFLARPPASPVAPSVRTLPLAAAAAAVTPLPMSPDVNSTVVFWAIWPQSPRRRNVSCSICPMQLRLGRCLTTLTHVACHGVAGSKPGMQRSHNDEHQE